MTDNQKAVLDALAELGVSLEQLTILQRASFQEATVLLGRLKKTVNDNFRRLAKELHPDCNGGDARKTEHFMFLSQIRAQVESFHLPHPNPRPGYAWVHPFATINVNGVDVPIPVASIRVIRFR